MTHRPFLAASLFAAWAALTLACCGAGNLGQKPATPRGRVAELRFQASLTTDPARRADLEAEAARYEKEEAIARAKQEAQKREAEKAREIREAEAARREEERAKADAAREARNARISRDNYDRIQNGMTLAQVQAILGPGTESASGPGVLVATWQTQPGFLELPTIISITFQNDRVSSKAIAP